MKNALLTTIPFDGFYYSLWDEELDREFENRVEYDASPESERNPLGLDEDVFNDALLDAMDWSKCHKAVAKSYTDLFALALRTDTDIDIPVRFESLNSPREYNFTTDRIFAHIRLGHAYLLFRRSRADDHARLREYAREHWTSRWGFNSYYDPDITDLLRKPLREWDHNELHALIAASLDDDEHDNSLTMRIYSAWPDGLVHEFEAGVDWQRYDNAIADATEKEIEARRAENPDYRPPYRCPETPDLFEVRP